MFFLLYIMFLLIDRHCTEDNMHNVCFVFYSTKKGKNSMYKCTQYVVCMYLYLYMYT